MQFKRTLLALFVLVLCAGGALAQVTNTSTGNTYSTIQAAIDDAVAGNVIQVGDGVFNENVNINKPVTLISENGAGSTTIQGSAAQATAIGGGNLGTLCLSVDGVAIGTGTDNGFTVIGYDWAAPAVEHSAVYIKSSVHGSISIIGNNLVAAGEAALLAGYGCITGGDVVIASNTFSGQTYVGPTIGGTSSVQYSVPNVPRSMVYFGGNNVGISFHDNVLSGSVGGVIEGTSDTYFNTGATIDCNGATSLATGAQINDNTFMIPSWAALRARGGYSTVTGNTFGASGGTEYVGAYYQNIETGVFAGNTRYMVPGMTIQEGHDSAFPGDVVHIPAGVYEEQVHITTSDIVFVGAGKGDNPLSDTIILSPVNLAWFYTTSADNKPVVGFDGVIGVTLQNLRVDGAGRGNANNRFQGVAFWNSGGTLTNVDVVNVEDTPFSGNQHGIGVYAYNNTGGPYHISLTDVNVLLYQKGGVALSGDGLTVSLTRVNTPGRGVTDVTAQNGIQVAYGASGSIVDCEVSGIHYSGTDWVASGVLLYQAEEMTIDNSTITGSQVSVYNYQGDLELENTAVTGATEYGAYSTVSGAKSGPQALKPSPFEEDWSGASKATGTVKYDQCTFSGIGAEGGYGAGFVSSGGGEFTMTDCSVTNFDIGLFVEEEVGSLTGYAHSNSISSNVSFEAGIYTAAPFDIAYNYWGGANPTDVVDFAAKAMPIFSPWYLLPIGSSPMIWGTNGSIQAALDIANPGDTVNVLAGTYDESLVFNKTVSLLGPNAALSPNTDTRLAEAVLMPSGGHAITGGANDIIVAFRGMTVDMALAAVDDRFVDQVTKTGTSFTFEHNIFQNASQCGTGNWRCTGANTGNVMNILDNLFRNSESGNGIALWGSDPWTVDIQDNVWENNETWALNLNSAQGAIKGNTFRDTRSIDVNDPGFMWYVYQSGIVMSDPLFDLDIEDNLFQNVFSGLNIYADVDGPINITNNIFDGVGSYAVKAASYEPEAGANLDEVVVSGNSFLNYFGNDYIVQNQRADNAVLNAELNWWGTADGAAIDLLADDFVDYDPWLGMASAAMTPASSGPVSCGTNVTLTFSLTKDDYTPDVFLFNTVVRATGPVNWGAINYSEPFGIPNNFHVFDNEDGTYTIDGATFGGDPQYISGPGTTDLFTITFQATGNGLAEITIEDFDLRDPFNQPIDATVSGATIEVDCTNPPAVMDITAIPAPTSDQNGVEVSWAIADNSDVDHYEIWRAIWHDGDGATTAYPEYDDLLSDAEPTRVSQYSDLATSTEWTRIDEGNVLGTETSITDTDAAMDRGVYYYEIIPVDEAGNIADFATFIDRATSYYLGDFDLDGQVGAPMDLDDLTAFGLAFGTQPGHARWNNAADIGPTDTGMGLGIPATDNVISFEDLMIFSLNYGVFGSGAKSDLEIRDTARLAWVSYGEGQYGLRLKDARGLQGLRVRANLAADCTITVTEGELMSAQSEPVFLRNLGNGLDLNISILGHQTAFTGEGGLVLVESSVPLTADDLVFDLRGSDNSQIQVELSSETGVLTPRVFGLYANYPNPFNPMTKISFSLPEEQPVCLNIYGLDGKLVRQLLNETRGSGMHEVVWDGRGDAGQMQASGLYFYRIEAGPYSHVRKMTLMK